MFYIAHICSIVHLSDIMLDMVHGSFCYGCSLGHLLTKIYTLKKIKVAHLG